jgi:hypothetical protein
MIHGMFKVSRKASRVAGAERRRIEGCGQRMESGRTRTPRYGYRLLGMLVTLLSSDFEHALFNDLPSSLTRNES